MKKHGPTKANMTGRATGQDVVMTPPETAHWIVNYFEPSGKLLEPCRGEGAFYNALVDYNHECKGLSVEADDVDWCEISEGKDFMNYDKQVDWIITNPPYSIFDSFLKKAMSISDNIVFFVPLSKLFKSKTNDIDVYQYGGIKEIINMGTGTRHGFAMGFLVGAIHYQKDYQGDIKYTRSPGAMK
tara:strand:- start:674 stop:1228 length:555 start_codon:yes stop_codon:yes gene_type:complete